MSLPERYLARTERVIGAASREYARLSVSSPEVARVPSVVALVRALNEVDDYMKTPDPEMPYAAGDYGLVALQELRLVIKGGVSIQTIARILDRPSLEPQPEPPTTSPRSRGSSGGS